MQPNARTLIGPEPSSGNLDDSVDKRAQLLPRESSEFLEMFIKKADNGDAVSRFEIARFRLLGSVVSKLGNDEIHLGVHDANVIYVDRGNVSLGRLENIGLFASGLSHCGSETVPIWCWYKELDGFKSKVLSQFSINSSVTISVGALTAMTIAGEPIIPADEIDREGYLQSWLAHDVNSSIKIAALKYLAKWGRASDMRTIRSEMDRSDYQTRSWATDALFKIALRESHESALDLLIESQANQSDKSILQTIFLMPSRLNTAKLIEATSHRAPRVRLSAAIALSQRKELPEDTSKILLSDTAANIRYEALMALEQSGREFTETEAEISSS